MHKLAIVTAAALALVACNAYIPDERIAGHLSPVCAQFPTMEGCQVPSNMDRVGTMIVIPSTIRP